VSTDRVERKKRMALEKRRFRSGPGDDPRRPKGQRVTKEFPVLDLGTQPVVTEGDWETRITGEVAKEIRLDWSKLDEFPFVHLKSDIHCVTGWSRYDNLWKGIRPRWILDAVQPSARVTHVLARSYDGYSTVLPMSALTHEDSLIATHWNDEPLTREHGGPVRLVIPSLYFWKSLKWLHSLTFVTKYQHGYWEALGYHPDGDPWKEQRYE
jgi:DMSO/TMAO reductase YedYZ molybdopterin-dependent catalytic subunit